MQPNTIAGARIKDFARAVNDRELGPLGDPERWGGFAAIELTAPAGAPSDQTKLSSQIVRAQCPDLIARAWTVICFWTSEGADQTGHDNGESFLEITAGCGQASGTGRVILVSGLIAPWPTPWQNGPFAGTFQVPQPIPGSAIAIRAGGRLISDGTIPVHTVRATFTVCIAPRAL
jgi:hypothetical protein